MSFGMPQAKPHVELPSQAERGMCEQVPVDSGWT